VVKQRQQHPRGGEAQHGAAHDQEGEVVPEQDREDLGVGELESEQGDREHEEREHVPKEHRPRRMARAADRCLAEAPLGTGARALPAVARAAAMLHHRPSRRGGRDGTGGVAELMVRPSRIRSAAAGALVAAGVLALALPHVLSSWQLTPDSIEYLGIAHSLASGAGLVDPVVYSHYLPPRYPMPAAAVRPPLVPLLLALPLGLGATIETAGLLHALWAACVAAFVFVLARRWASAPSALAAAIGFGWSFGWIVVARLLLTEVTAVALVLALVAWAPRALTSLRGALAFAALAFAAWLCRPNLAVAVPALLAAIFLAPGGRRALASRVPWLGAAAFVALVAGFSVAMRAATGISPYAHNGLLFQTLGAEDARQYQRVYLGLGAYLAAHGEQVANLLLWNAREILRTLFTTPSYHYVGWLALPGLVRALRARGPGALERRFVAWLTLGSVVPAVVIPGSVDPLRLSLFLALGGWLLAADVLDASVRWIAGRLPAGRARAGLRLAPVALVLALFLLSPSARAQLRSAASAWREYTALGTEARSPGWPRVAKLCPLLERDALVASDDPWSVYLWCGNAGLWLPVDLDTPQWVDRYLDEQAPGYVIVEERGAAAALREAPRLERIAEVDGLAVYRLRDPPPRSRPWRAPPALAPRSRLEPRAGDSLGHRTLLVR
jgi:hypothetical protein